MEEPVADVLRGTLDGHVILDREIAERGRFPAIDILRSVSRSLPEAASEPENDLLTHARRLLGQYEKIEPMMRAGLYREGADPRIDEAVAAWPELDSFVSDKSISGHEQSFAKLNLILRRAAAGTIKAAS
jgi:flagellum-specific ATP synthase